MRILPNALTIARLAMAPVFVLVYFLFPGQPIWAFLVYLLAMLTDAVDGRLARAMNCVSRFGALVDPLADKLMTLSAIICLTYTGNLPYVVLILVAAREIIMVTGGFLAARTGIVIFAGIPGKLATILFTISLALVIPWHGVPEISKIGAILIYPAIALSLFAAVYYAVILVKKTATAKPH
jgi:CDP-diacylglycerol--glycerol-3-phosphate 3-phosphatidyltransferase